MIYFKAQCDKHGLCISFPTEVMHMQVQSSTLYLSLEFLLT